MSVTFNDYSGKVKAKLGENCEAFLLEATAEIASQAADNSPIDTGQLKGSWSTEVDGNTGYVGSGLEYAIWQEFGTGEYALEGNGRKGGWFYVDDEGKGHFTRGTKPKRMLWNAWMSKKAAIIARAKEIGIGMGGK